MQCITVLQCALTWTLYDREPSPSSSLSSSPIAKTLLCAFMRSRSFLLVKSYPTFGTRKLFSLSPSVSPTRRTHRGVLKARVGVHTHISPSDFFLFFLCPRLAEQKYSHTLTCIISQGLQTFTGRPRPALSRISSLNFFSPENVPFWINLRSFSDRSSSLRTGNPSRCRFQGCYSLPERSREASVNGLNAPLSIEILFRLFSDRSRLLRTDNPSKAPLSRMLDCCQKGRDILVGNGLKRRCPLLRFCSLSVLVFEAAPAPQTTYRCPQCSSTNFRLNS